MLTLIATAAAITASLIGITCLLIIKDRVSQARYDRERHDAERAASLVGYVPRALFKITPHKVD